MILGLDWHAWFTILLIITMFAILLKTKLPTHLMVYGPGDYRFNDFLKIGIPMNIIILAANIFITTLVFPL